MMALAVVLVLQPVLAEDGALRLAATGVGDAEVTWLLDGAEVARTADREATVVAVAAGVHELRAVSEAQGRWTAMARPDGSGDGAAYVPAWAATHEPALRPASAEGHLWRPSLPLGLAVLALVMLAWPGRSGLEALRRLRRR